MTLGDECHDVDVNNTTLDTDCNDVDRRRRQQRNTGTSATTLMCPDVNNMTLASDCDDIAQEEGHRTRPAPQAPSRYQRGLSAAMYFLLNIWPIC